MPKKTKPANLIYALECLIYTHLAHRNRRLQLRDHAVRLPIGELWGEFTNFPKGIEERELLNYSRRYMGLVKQMDLPAVLRNLLNDFYKRPTEQHSLILNSLSHGPITVWKRPKPESPAALAFVDHYGYKYIDSDGTTVTDERSVWGDWMAQGLEGLLLPSA